MHNGHQCGPRGAFFKHQRCLMTVHGGRKGGGESGGDLRYELVKVCVNKPDKNVVQLCITAL